MKELWKDIKGYEGLYRVSNTGKVESVERISTTMGRGGVHRVGGYLLKQSTDKDGYKTVVLYLEGKTKRFLVHRLVATAFIPNPENKPCIDHISAVRDENTAENLRWVTPSENSANPLYLEYCHNRKHTEEEKKKISEAHKGAVFTPEHCKNISIAKRSQCAVSQTSEDGSVVKIWDDVQDAVDWCNVTRQYFFRRARQSKICRGFYWVIKKG